MFRIVVLMIIVAAIIGSGFVVHAQETVSHEDPIEPPIGEDADIQVTLDALAEVEKSITSQIDQIESLMAVSNRHLEEGISPKAEINKVFLEMAKLVTNINDLVNNNLTYTKIFMVHNGLTRVVFSNLEKPSKRLRAEAILLLKSIFDTFPETGKVLPVKESGKLLKILESKKHDPSVAHIIDIFSKWLPENPNLQKEVLDNNGLLSFYNIFPKIGTQLKILTVNILDEVIDEHVRAVEEEALKEKYEDVGLLVTLKHHDTCDGLLSVFTDLFSSGFEDAAANVAMAKIMDRVLPFCKEVFKNNANLNDLLTNMSEHYAEDKNIAERGSAGTEMILEVLKKYKEAFPVRVKDEL